VAGEAPPAKAVKLKKKLPTVFTIGNLVLEEV